MRSHGLNLDLYTTEIGYGQVAHITAEESGFLWQHETADQIVTRTMEWDELLDSFQTVGLRKRCGLYVQKRLAVEAAVKRGAAIIADIGVIFEALLPVYDASVGA
jgi:hypothetical protein